jgi:hypothetical protein
VEIARQRHRKAGQGPAGANHRYIALEYAR